MKRLTLVAAMAALLALSVSACASRAGSLGPAPTAASTSPSAPATTSTTTTPGHSPSPTGSPARLLRFQLWLTRGGKLFETKRTTPFNAAVGKLVLDTLVQGPNAAESAAGISTAIPSGTTFRIAALSGGVATVQASPAPSGSLLPWAQVVYTLTQYGNIRSVRDAGDGSTYTRNNLESYLPAIIVESPVIGQQVSSPVTVSGTANVFEATVSIRILDGSGKQIARTFTTATCGTGCRGDYSTSVPYHVNSQQSGVIEVFESSAKDGSAINVQRIPVTLSP